MADLKDLEKQVKSFDKRLKKIEKMLMPYAYSKLTNDKDPLYGEAKKLILQSKNATASFLQRKMSIGYARAARILDELYQSGVVGPGSGSEPRKILLKANT